jgi:hypothetical protein
MTVSTTTIKALYDCIGALTYTIPFGTTYFDATEIRVVHRSVAGAETPLILDTNFTVPAYGEANYGSIVLIGTYADTPPTTGEKILLSRILPLTQLVDLSASYDYTAIMEALDRQVMINQQLQEQIDRATLTDETGD